MFVFLDFEASSLGKTGYPIEVAWVFADGRSESHLIRTAPGWTDWADDAEAIHHIDRVTLERDGIAHDVVARRMVEALTGHDLFASAPSWDGKWLSALLRAAGLPRHSLRLRSTEDARRNTMVAIIGPVVEGEALDDTVEDLLTLADLRCCRGEPRHRALADAEGEYQRWLLVKEAADAFVAQRRGG